MKCLNCDKEAKWKSTIYVSPLCSACARKEVDNLIKTGKYSIDETAVIDFYEPITINCDNFKNITNFNPVTGEISYNKK